jgi:enterochelin esterase-like enzyme
MSQAGGVSRRSVLLGAGIGAVAAVAGAGGLVEAGVLPGRIELERALGRAGTPGRVPGVAAGPVRKGSFASVHRRGAATNWVVAYPPGVDPDHPVTPAGARLPVCAVLHGKGSRAADMPAIGYPNFLAAAVRAGGPAFALAAVDGGDDYWHRRADGDDPGTMLLAEFLPRLEQAGLAAGAGDRIAFLGWSMGGYGAFLLASGLGPGRVAAIAAESPALWTSAGETAAGAFDDAADYRAHDVFARTATLRRIPIRIDCGDADAFQGADRAFARRLGSSAVAEWGAGDHSWGFWRARAAKSIAFVGIHLGRS